MFTAEEEAYIRARVVHFKLGGDRAAQQTAAREMFAAAKDLAMASGGVTPIRNAELNTEINRRIND